MAGILSEIVDHGILPPDPTGILPYITEADGTFISSEGPNWDFKGSWPHSYSDSYFHGLCRLICAFANTQGGVIVFGVSDLERKGGQNRIKPNLDRFLQAFQQLVGTTFAHDFRSYKTDATGQFEVLLVRSIDSQTLPLRFRRASNHYRFNTIWVREGHEVIEAEPRHIAQLYCRSEITLDLDNEIDGNLPPSPSTIRKFVGRVNVIDEIFEWLKTSDQPRTFLYGKGGSGKSTIAFNVAKVLREHGQGFRIEGDSPLECVMYLSAKERELNSDTQSQQTYSLNDFKDEKSLYEAIIIEGGSEIETLDGLGIKDLRSEICKLFDRMSCFIVIDDIDTLTTKGLEAGFDFLFGALCRSKKKTKILYTLRNAPSQSISNSIDVPGLSIDGEYQEFIKLASEQFKVIEPSTHIRDDSLLIISERRPLVVESIIALRRRVDSYERAIELFKQNGGDDVRAYVFRREWDAIRANSNGRELLCVLALYNGAISYDDLVALMYDNAAIIPDALSEVQEMFVEVERRNDISFYKLNELTRSFVSHASKQLDRYSGLRTRVQKFRTNIYADDVNLNSLLRRVDRLIARARFDGDKTAGEQAWSSLMDARSDDATREDPRYMAACGYAALNMSPPNISEAREYFKNSFAMRHAPEESYIRQWFMEEHRGDAADIWTDVIFKLVNGARGYGEELRMEFLSRRASTLYNLARDGFYTEPQRSLDRLIESMKMHALGFSRTCGTDTKQAIMFQRNFTNTAFYLKNRLQKAESLDSFLTSILELTKVHEMKLDPLLEPVRELCLDYLDLADAKSMARAAGKLTHFAKVLGESSCWIDQAIRMQCRRYCDDAVKELHRRDLVLKRQRMPLSRS